MKKILFTVLAGLFFAGTGIFAEKFLISEVDYNIDGKTKPEAIERVIGINKTKIFQSEEELASYIEELKVLFENERNFQSSELSYEAVQSDNSEITNVKLTVSVKDSKHLLIVPYPKYDSNSGFSAKLKMRDTNPFGLLNTMNFDLVYETEKNDEDENKTDNKLGGSFDYRLPFKIGRVEASWNNADNIYYTFGENRPEFDANTGFTFTVPVAGAASASGSENRISVVFDVMQGIAGNFDYKKYGDEIYGKTDSKLSMPVLLARTKKLSKIQWGPYVSETARYDSDGIKESNEDLTGPIVFGGHEFSMGQINWIGNFRDGIYLSVDNAFGYNFQRKDFIPKIAAELNYFKAFGKAGFNSRIRGFAMDNRREEFASKLRGIVDKYYYKNYVNEYGERTSSALAEVGLICNFDFPVHIFTTDFGQIFDFELQIAPFVDFAFVSNPKTGRTFAFQDGFYSAGLEVLVYPLKWRSIVVRGSAGVDVSRLCNFDSGTNDTADNWNNKLKAYEIFIGIGWHY